MTVMAVVVVVVVVVASVEEAAAAAAYEWIETKMKSKSSLNVC